VRKFELLFAEGNGEDASEYSTAKVFHSLSFSLEINAGYYLFPPKIYA